MVLRAIINLIYLIINIGEGGFPVKHAKYQLMKIAVSGSPPAAGPVFH